MVFGVLVVAELEPACTRKSELFYGCMNVADKFASEVCSYKYSHFLLFFLFSSFLISSYMG